MYSKNPFCPPGFLRAESQLKREKEGFCFKKKNIRENASKPLYKDIEFENLYNNHGYKKYKQDIIFGGGLI